MGAVAAVLSLVPLLQGATEVAPLPAEPPIGGPIWTILIPAVLFLGSTLGTYLLYKKFSTVEVGE
jgi:hypothetical protein